MPEDGTTSTGVKWASPLATSRIEAGRSFASSGIAWYEERFGHIYIVCASGRGPEEILNDLNGPEMNSRASGEPASFW